MDKVQQVGLFCIIFVTERINQQVMKTKLTGMKKMKTLLLAGTAMILMQACESSVKEANLPVRKPCNLERLYKDMPQDIRSDTPDMAFVNALCAGKADEVAGLFREKKLFWDEPPAIDAPYGRFEGLDGIRSFAKGFLAKFNATSATFTPVFQTIGGGRIALEGVFKFVVDEAIEEVPFFVITDLRMGYEKRS